MPYRLSEAARADVADILRQTVRRFGPQQRRTYAGLIAAAATMVADDPMRPGSRDCDELAPGLRSFHVELAARQRGAAAHVLYYLPEILDDASEGVVILRVLHERMDPIRHIVQDA